MSAGSGPLAVDIVGPIKTSIELQWQKDAVVVARYTPERCGDYTINITFAGTHIEGDFPVVTKVVCVIISQSI